MSMRRLLITLAAAIGLMATVVFPSTPAIAASHTDAPLIAFIAGNDSPPSGDRRFVSWLERQGYEVLIVDDDDATPALVAGSGADVGIVSSSVLPTTLDPDIADVPVPMLLLEGYALDDFGLATRSGETTKSWDKVRMANSGHPLEGGLTFTPKVLNNPSKMNFGIPGGDAIHVATEPSAPRNPVYFAYESGAELADGSTAAARRVAFPFPVYQPDFQNVNGGGRVLMQAAIDWLLAETTIMAIQGGAHLSPRDGSDVATMGVVTGVAFNGFYMQDPVGDGDPNTSDGIFVFGFGLGAAAGDMVKVTGSVSEFIPGGAGTGNLSTTQISADNVDVVSSGNPLPDPVIIGSGGILPPNEIVISDSELPTNLQSDPAVFNPDVDGIDFYEALEGMRVTVEEPVTTSATRTFNPFSSEFWTLPSDGAGVAPPDARTGRGGILLQPDPDNRGDQNPERVQIQLDGTLFPDPVPALTVGTALSDITGVVGYSFGNYEVNATESFTSGPGQTPEVSEIVNGDDILTVASYNVLNLSADGSDTAQLATLGTQIVDHLNSPDILAVQEIQDNNGSGAGPGDGVTDASETLQALVDAIAAAGGPTYEAFDVAPEEGTSGGVPGGNIRNAFLYNDDRVDLVEYASLTPEVLGLLGASNPDAFLGTRNPLAARFQFNGQNVEVVNNHLTSRFGSTPIFGGPQPFVQAGELEREAQVGALNEVVDALLAGDPDLNVIVTGDLNTFEWTNDLAEILPGVGPDKVLNNLDPIDDATNDRYTFIFDGNSQALDHMFVSDNVLGTSPVLDIVHVNNDFPRVDATVGSDHEPLLAQMTIPVPEPSETFSLQVLHASDLEGGVDALDRAPNFAAIVDQLEENSDVDASVTLSAGDNYIPGPFFNASGDRATFREGGVFNDVYNDLYGLPGAYDSLREGGGRSDISIMNIIGFDASAVGNHEFDGGSDAMANIIENDFRSPNGPASDRWVGAQFPYLSSNLDFSGDAALGALFTDQVLPNTAFETGPLQSAGGTGDRPKLAPSTWIDVGGGERVGVVGVTTPLLEQISSPTGTTVIGPTENDMAALAPVVQPAIDGLTAVGINKIVLVTHLQQLDREEELATLLTDVDVIIAGGSDTLLANADDPLRPGDVAEDQYPVLASDLNGDPTAIVSTDGEYSYVGQLNVLFNADGILVDSNGDPLADLSGLDLDANGPVKTEEEDVEALWAPDDAFAEGTKGELVSRLVEAVEGVVIDKDSNVLGESSVFIEGRREFVRTEETNMGNLSADANLAVGQGHDSSVVASIKNGGGIRAEIGEIVNIGNDTFLLPPQANPLSGKEDGQVSQLDVENSLRFNNSLSLLTLTAAQMQEVVEHAVAETGPGATPGQFAQIGGMAFSYDATQAAGSRVQTLSIVDDTGALVDNIVQGGALQGDPARTFRIVTLNFLAGGGDGYPFPDDAAADRVDLPDVLTDSGMFDFADPGTEQDAIAEFLGSQHPIGGVTPFDSAETAPTDDERIQDLGVRSDTVPVGPGA